MESFYTWCATIAGVLFLGQFVLSLLGAVDDFDFDTGDADGFDHGGTTFAGYFSFRAVTAAVTVFGLAGLGASRELADPNRSLLIALAAGAGVFVGVGYLLSAMTRLNASGNVDANAAVGRSANVYLTVPSEKSGQGKVTLELQGRTVEFRAVTDGEALPTGAAVTITSFQSPGVVEVEPVPHNASETA